MPEAEPTDAEPTTATPAGAQPVGAEPTTATPADTAPAGAEPVGAEPTGIAPADAAPAEVTFAPPMPPAPAPGPVSVPVSEADRQAAIDRIQQALAEDLIDFDSLDDRFALVYRAANRAELDAALAGLPPTSVQPPARSARHLAPATNVTLIGDLKVGGWIAVGPSMTSISLIGDTIVDLSSADIPPEGLELRAFTLIGNVKVITPDGARIQTQGMNLLGDTRQELVAPTADGPTIRITTFSFIGDVVVQSLSRLRDRKLKRYWRKLRQNQS